MCSRESNAFEVPYQSVYRMMLYASRGTKESFLSSDGREREANAHTHTGTHTFDFNIWLCLVRLCPPQVMLVGDSGVGKTCLLVRFKDGAFLAGSFISTVGIDFRVSTRKPRVQNQAVTRWDVLILTAPVAIVCDQFINNKSIKCTYNDQRLDLQSTFSL